jgi:hypothetical protein
VVWAGADGGAGVGADHPRNLSRPFQPQAQRVDAQRLRRAAQQCRARLAKQPSRGLMAWLNGAPLPLALALAAPRFDAIGQALQSNDLPAFEHAALRVLGLGSGLTPSGDDFIGAICFALLHSPRKQWRAHMPGLHARIRQAASHASKPATNPISAALLDDLLNGRSFRALHQMVAALDSEDPTHIEAATQALLSIGASSGADMLSGLLLALGSWQASF